MTVRVLHGDCRAVLPRLPDASVHCIVTSPPYFGLRDYGCEAQIGLERTPEEYVAELVAVFREAGRVLRDDGTLWLNLGDSYASSTKGTGGDGHKSGLRRDGRPETGRLSARDTIARQQFEPRRFEMSGAKPKDLLGMPWRVAFALQADGWFLRQDIIWAKPNPLPESVLDRCTKAHEYVFLLSKWARYWYDAEAIAEPAVQAEFRPTSRGGAYIGSSTFDNSGSGGRSTDVGDIRIPKQMRNRRSVWTIASQPYKGAHFATMPPDLAALCIKAGCPKGGTVLDPFGGSGTTGLVADRLGRDAVLIELNPEYSGQGRARIEADAGLFAQIVEADLRPA